MACIIKSLHTHFMLNECMTDTIRLSININLYWPVPKKRGNYHLLEINVYKGVDFDSS